MLPIDLDLIRVQLPPRYQRESRHDCHCGPTMYWPDQEGCCQHCGRFPRSVVALANATRKRPRQPRRIAA